MASGGFSSYSASEPSVALVGRRLLSASSNSGARSGIGLAAPLAGLARMGLLTGAACPRWVMGVGRGEEGRGGEVTQGNIREKENLQL